MNDRKRSPEETEAETKAPDAIEPLSDEELEDVAGGWDEGDPNGGSGGTGGGGGE